MNTERKVKMQARTMTRRSGRSGTCPAVRAAGLFLLAGVALACSRLDAAERELLDISHVMLQGNKQQIALTLSGPATLPKAFTIDNPARIALDLAGTSNGLDERSVRVGSGLLDTVTTVEAGGRTRVVLNLSSLTPYRTAVRGNQLIVTLAADSDADGGAPDGGAELAAAEPAVDSDSGADGGRIIERRNSIDALDFRRGPMGEGRIVFDLSSAGVVTDMRQEGGRIIVDFPDTELAAKLQKRLDVMDFGTPVQFIDAIANKRGTKVIIQPATQEFEQLAYQSDDMFTVELKPMSREEIEENRKAKFGYVGEKLSLNFQDIEVRSVLQLLADFTDLNIVVSDSVQGKLTLRLKNVPWTRRSTSSCRPRHSGSARRATSS